MITVFTRTFIIYIVLVGAVRLMGKRQIGELQISELVTTFLLSELAVIPIQNTETPVMYAVFPILLLLSLEVIISFVLMKSSKLKLFFTGRPSMVVYKGKLNQKELLKLRIGINELISELRLKNIGDIADVEYAILEENGKLSVFPTVEKSPLTPAHIDLAPSESGIAHPLVVDGEISDATLKLLKKDKTWLTKILKNQSLSVEEIFLMTIDDGEKTNVIKKDRKDKKR